MVKTSQKLVSQSIILLVLITFQYCLDFTWSLIRYSYVAQWWYYIRIITYSDFRKERLVPQYIKTTIHISLEPPHIKLGQEKPVCMWGESLTCTSSVGRDQDLHTSPPGRKAWTRDIMNSCYTKYYIARKQNITSLRTFWKTKLSVSYVIISSW